MNDIVAGATALGAGTAVSSPLGESHMKRMDPSTISAEELGDQMQAMNIHEADTAEPVVHRVFLTEIPESVDKNELYRCVSTFGASPRIEMIQNDPETGSMQGSCANVSVCLVLFGLFCLVFNVLVLFGVRLLCG